MARCGSGSCLQLQSKLGNARPADRLLSLRRHQCRRSAVRRNRRDREPERRNAAGIPDLDPPDRARRAPAYGASIHDVASGTNSAIEFDA